MKKSYVVLVSSLVLLDILTKVLAVNLLPLEEVVGKQSNGFYFYLLYNDAGISWNAETLYGSNKTFYLVSSILYFLLRGVVLYLHKRKLRKSVLIIITLFSMFFIAVFANISTQLFSYEPSDYFISWFKIAGSLFFAIVVFIITERKNLKYTWLVLIAGGVGNFLSHFYPPFKIVDFVYSSALATYLRLGIMNMSDLYIHMGGLALICISVYEFALIKVVRKFRWPS